MSTIKCTQCGLVNFSNMTHCQRCREALTEIAATAVQNPFQTNVLPAQAYRTQPLYQNRPAQFQPYQTPPPPPVFQNDFARQQQAYQPTPLATRCVKCGGVQNVILEQFKKDYVPPVAYLGIFMGVLPFLILMLVLRVTHHINAPFCTGCWDKFRKVSTIETLSTLGFFVGITAGFITMFMFETGFAFLFFFALTIAFIVWGQIYKYKYSPKFKKINREKLVIDAPMTGELSFYR